MGNDQPFKPQPLHPGPWKEMTHGEIWPKPYAQTSEQEFFVLDPENFKFQVCMNLFTYFHYAHNTKLAMQTLNLCNGLRKSYLEKKCTHSDKWAKYQKIHLFCIVLRNFLKIQSFIFQLVGVAKTCEILQKSLKRFYGRAFPGKLSSRNRKSICRDNSCSPYFLGTLPQVLVKMPRNSQCEELPHDNMDEKCKYNVVYLIGKLVSRRS